MRRYLQLTSIQSSADQRPFKDASITYAARHPNVDETKQNVQHMGRTNGTLRTAQSQLDASLQLGRPCGSRPQPSMIDEHSREDESDDSLLPTDRLGPGIVTYQRPLRGSKAAVVSPECLSCGCNCKAKRKMDKGIQAQPESDQDHTYYEDSKELSELVEDFVWRGSAQYVENIQREDVQNLEVNRYHGLPSWSRSFVGPAVARVRVEIIARVHGRVQRRPARSILGS
ncbi:hypothetical protein MTO96_008613 [Rhipicephalus appendiculatus]